ncbi:MAG: hypothetical protein ACP5O3_02560 [Candidatus Micrarchaeia archaeon]
MLDKQEELLSKWKAALNAFAEADAKLKKYCEENNLVLSKCDYCGREVLVSPEPPEKDGSASVLRWNFCSDACRTRYWQESC